MLHCPNHTCQTRNPETNRFCQACGAFLPKHYLWAIGHDVDQYHPGDILANRYYCKAPRIFLDTQPGINPDPFQELPVDVNAYLKLAPYRLHVPQLYDVVATGTEGSAIVLVDDSPIDIMSSLSVADTSPDLRNPSPPAEVMVQLLPTLTQAWPKAIALRQLNWLWQIAQLWQPLQLQGVTRTLLTPDKLRVEGGILRLLDLQGDDPDPPKLSDLGDSWLDWLPQAQPAIAPFFEHLCRQLTQGHIQTVEQLIGRLDAALALAGRSLTRHVTLSTQTDQGPHRKRNEDACFPASGSLERYTLNSSTDPSPLPIAIVCDGIGGHQGGDVASGLAIATIQEQIQALQPNNLTPLSLTLALEQAACAANDVISQRNDQEQRHDRERMGTTLVMGLIHQHELYITHVGDSRAYRISHQGYHQVTLDDDIASREVRMGYSSFRQALQQPIGGSLVQALGMGPSSILRPTVQRFILDEDCIVLLCSDGLSDFDRVDEYWDSTLLGVLQHKLSVEQVTRELVTIANTRNGHDNVTIGLLYCAVEAAQMPTIPASLAIAPDPAPTTHRPESAEPTPTIAVETPVKPESPNVAALILSSLLLVGIGAVIGYLLFPNALEQWLVQSPEPAAESASSEPEEPAATSSLEPLTELSTQNVIQLRRAPTDGELLLYANPPSPTTAADEPAANLEPIGQPAVGSVFLVQSRAATTPGIPWVQLQVCSTPTDASLGRVSPAPLDPEAEPDPSNPEVGGESLPTSRDELSSDLLQPGDQGWALESDLLPLVDRLADPTPELLGTCTPPNS
ncbi:MAG: protein phosphatase 2C domain-containing protein [Synechococcales cyanobacterium K44_A2020_017]|nr:protein phosphatase 2C domain-containing protein [Synechococcales cyanobacterium K32_A2020_035]MBF2095245.1 protein phosphatase 2C domain-containing protein [Synechococcales cyanobacterium K44_A2020_017]